MQSFREILNFEFEKRKKINERYSLRGFARFLDISPSVLSKYLRGVRPFSPKVIDDLGSKLGLSMEQIKIVQAKEKQKKDQVIEYTQMDLDSFNIVSEWYYGAIMQLPLLKNFSSDSKWISEVLGLKNKTVISALQTLARLKFIEFSDDQTSWKRVITGMMTMVEGHKTNEASKRNIRQQHEHSLYALEHIDAQLRDHSGMTMAIAQEDVPKIKKMVLKFRREVLKELGQSKNKDSVYQLNISFFPLTKSDDDSH